MAATKTVADPDKLERIVAEARRAQDQREKSYRERALKMYPWICGRCSREFTHKNLRELTVHHRNHDHDCNPLDGSNWELLCLYCHDNEHSRYIDETGSGEEGPKQSADDSHHPFADLKALLKGKEQA